MKQVVLFVLVMTGAGLQAQHKYRFSVGGGFHSLMFWGFRSFEGVNCPADYSVLRIYNTEKYTVDYRNFSSSVDYSYGFSVNWVNRKNILISQRFSYFKGTLHDGLRLELTAVGDGTLAYYPLSQFNASNTGVGSGAALTLDSELTGYATALVCYTNSAIKNVQVGGGVYFSAFLSHDLWWNSAENVIEEGYHPVYLDRGSGYYGTQQIGLSANLIWSWKFIHCYLNLGNSIITTKKAENKGKWYGKFTFFPTSHNFDYRFPLSIETGIAVSFDKIKKRKE